MLHTYVHTYIHTYLRTYIHTYLQVLEFMDVDKYEVPFIWSYRRDYLGGQIDRERLWRIAQLDERWEELQKRKVCR